MEMSKRSEATLTEDVGEVEDIVGALTLVVGGSNRFSMIFLLC